MDLTLEGDGTGSMSDAVFREGATGVRRGNDESSSDDDSSSSYGGNSADASASLPDARRQGSLGSLASSAGATGPGPVRSAIKRSHDSTLGAAAGGAGGVASGAGLGSAADRDDDELKIPRASLNKMIKELAPNVRVANDARELILNCCTEFVHLLSSEANELCNKQMKKTISPEHVLAALDSLGFGSYKEDACAVLQEAKAVAAKKRRASSKLENLGIPEEELLRQQQELFAKARLEQEIVEQREWQRVQEQLQQQQLQQQQLLQQHQQSSAPDDYN